MNIIICGAGRVGFTIAKLLTEQNHSVTVIDQSSEDIQKINETLDVKAIVGKATYPSILEKANVDSNKKVSDWNDKDIASIRDVVGNLTIEGELRSETQPNIKRLMDIGSYRGIRHRTGLPLRGQRTKNNSRTRKGKRKTVANKKKATK